MIDINKIKQDMKQKIEEKEEKISFLHDVGTSLRASNAMGPDKTEAAAIVDAYRNVIEAIYLIRLYQTYFPGEVNEKVKEELENIVDEMGNFISEWLI